MVYELLITCVDCIFPPKDTTLRVRSLTSYDIKHLYTFAQINDTDTLSTYTHKNTRALIHEAKFRKNKKAFALLNTLLEIYLKQTTHQIDMIIPIPLSRARMRARGYNQVYEILRAGNIPMHIPIEQNVLTRVRDTRPQTELPRSERLRNMHDAFGVVHSEKIIDKHILLLDDVVTTGTTLKTAKATLLPYHPASVTCLALAH